MTKTPHIAPGSWFTMRVPDSRRWVRLLCAISRRPVPTRLQDYLVIQGQDGKIEFTAFEFRET